MCKHIFTPITHRGGTEAAFENTYEAFADAYALGYRWFETDVQISKDGFLYAIHDSNLNRIVGINININQLNSEDLDQILINGKHRIPRLDLLLRKFHDVTFNLDAKNIHAAKALVNLLNSDKSLKNLCVGSFSHKNMNYMRKNLLIMKYLVVWLLWNSQVIILKKLLGIYIIISVIVQLIADSLIFYVI